MRDSVSPEKGHLFHRCVLAARNNVLRSQERHKGREKDVDGRSSEEDKGVRWRMRETEREGEGVKRRYI